MCNQDDLGCYIPAFFKMSVNVDGNIDLNTMSPKDFSVFFHEYIHFIQDFTTAAGCRRIYVYGEYIRQCVDQIVNGNADFETPIVIPEFKNNILPNVKLLDTLEGDTENLSVVKIKNIETMDEKIVDKDGKILSFESLVVTTMGDLPISIGTCAIKESMAYLVEQLCTTSYVTSPDFPYNIARLIADFELGVGKIDNLVLLSLCDVSLLTSNPGMTFYRMLQMIKDKELIVNRPEDVYDDFYGRKSVKYDTGEVVTSISDYILGASLAYNALLSYYALDQFQDLNEWLNKVFSIGVAFRMKKPYFILEMARGAKDKSNCILQFFAKEIGAPMMENNKGQMYKLKMHEGEPPIEYLYVLLQLYKLFKFGDKSCELKKWCSQNLGQPIAMADSRCDEAPWSRCRDRNLFLMRFSGIIEDYLNSLQKIINDLIINKLDTAKYSKEIESIF